MTPFVYLPLVLLFAVLPAIFWFRGKRMFGSQTHPAAIFILALIASTVTLAFVEPLGQFSAPLSLVWVTFNFITFSLVGKLQKPKP